MFTIWRVAGWQCSIRRPPSPQANNCDDSDKHFNNGDNGNDNDNHRGAVETNTGESNEANFYLALLDNTTIRYVVAAMV